MVTAWDCHAALFVAEDAEDEPCVWLRVDDPEKPVALLRRCEISAEGRDALWRHVTKDLPKGVMGWSE